MVKKSAGTGLKASGYGSFCPIAKAAEILAERWTLLVLRELLLGSRQFNTFRRGIPQISPTLLSKRLQTLQDAGIVEHVLSADGHAWEYRPTQACEELRPIVLAIGHWGQSWVRSKLTRNELDPGMLMWYIHRHFATANLPARRIVIYLEFSDVKGMKRWWLVLEHQSVDLCLEDPGFDVDIFLNTDLLTLTQIYIGDTNFKEAVVSGKMLVDGPRSLTIDMWRWFARSKFAPPIFETGPADRDDSATRRSAYTA